MHLGVYFYIFDKKQEYRHKKIMKRTLDAFIKH
jgi:hypothetical protein